MFNDGLKSSNTSEWSTPQNVFDKLNDEFHFNLDPCCTHDNAKCVNYFTKTENGLSKSWVGYRVFMNPPYGRDIKHWMAKAYSCGADLVVCLVPARTDTKWWHDYAMQGVVRFIKGRLKFGDSKNSAPFPSAIVIFERNEFDIAVESL